MAKMFITRLACILFSCSFVVCYSVAFAAGASVDKLPTPELVSVTYNDYSYNVPASTSTNPFTGKPVENPAHHVENRTLTFVTSTPSNREYVSCLCLIYSVFHDCKGISSHYSAHTKYSL